MCKQIHFIIIHPLYNWQQNFSKTYKYTESDNEEDLENIENQKISF